jgi:two-component system sensor histidine kinase QseC
VTLQRRLLQLLLVAVPVIWAIAVAVSIWQVRLEINELFDSEQIRLAQQVMRIVSASDASTPRAPSDPAARASADAAPEGGSIGAAELKDMAIAAWAANGDLRVVDGDGERLPYRAGATGFVPLEIDGEGWLVYYLHPAGSSWVVAVGQATDERDEVLRGLLIGQLVPWALMLPVLLAAMAIAVRHVLRPVRRLAADIGSRGADDLHPVAVAGLPSELTPLVSATNRLFERIRRTLEHERRLTADAAHELRTPLAALRAQWEAVRVAGDEATRKAASRQVGAGIDRLSHVLAQLLALSGVDDRAPTQFTAMVDWRRVVQDALSDCLPLVEAQGSEIAVEWPPGDAPALPITGDDALLTLLLRNLVDNALRYTPPGTTVMVRLAADRLTVEDDGPGLAPDVLARLGDRFFRPAGQAASGSGLGVSIVRRVAELHGLDLHFANRAAPATGVRVEVTRKPV